MPRLLFDPARRNFGGRRVPPYVFYGKGFFGRWKVRGRDEVFKLGAGDTYHSATVFHGVSVYILKPDVRGNDGRPDGVIVTGWGQLVADGVRDLQDFRNFIRDF